MEEANDEEFAKLLKELEVPSPTIHGKQRRGCSRTKKSKMEVEKERALRLELEHELDEACEQRKNFRFQCDAISSVLDYECKVMPIEFSHIDSGISVSKIPDIKGQVITRADKKRTTIPYESKDSTLAITSKRTLQRKNSAINCKRRRIKRDIPKEIENDRIESFDSYVDYSGTVTCKKVTGPAKEHMIRMKLDIEEAMQDLKHCREQPQLFTSDAILQLKLKMLTEISSYIQQFKQGEPTFVNPFFDQIALKLHPCSVSGFARGISRSFHPIMLLKDTDCCFSLPESLIWKTQPFTGLIHVRNDEMDEDNLIHFLEKISGCEKYKAKKDPSHCALQLVRSKLNLDYDPFSSFKMCDDFEVNINENNRKPVKDREASSLPFASFVSPVKERGSTPIPAFDSSVIHILPQMETFHNNRDCANATSWQCTSTPNNFYMHNPSQSTVDLLLNETSDRTSEINFCTEYFEEL